VELGERRPPVRQVVQDERSDDQIDRVVRDEVQRLRDVGDPELGAITVTSTGEGDHAVADIGRDDVSAARGQLGCQVARCAPDLEHSETGHVTGEGQDVGPVVERVVGVGRGAIGVLTREVVVLSGSARGHDQAA
jgi:hypothetical protein